MRKDLADKWTESEETGKPVEIGDLVVCDWCDKDWTDSDQQGGFIFQSKATCPDCAPRMMQTIQEYGEERFIRARCAEGVSFADFVRAYRGPKSTVYMGKL